ncbi:MAG TPA: 3-hydroxyacyl-[acyl-carrier-protein] dehydratase FabZ, partial [Thermaerobacter sp.]
CAVLSLPENRGRLALFAGADRVRWRRPVVPGDCLEIEVEIVAVRGPVGKGRARATVDGELAAEAELSFALRPA